VVLIAVVLLDDVLTRNRTDINNPAGGIRVGFLECLSKGMESSQESEPTSITQGVAFRAGVLIFVFLKAAVLRTCEFLLLLKPLLEST
jgi:hypothetical protein